MAIVILKGTGQLNGTVLIDKELEMEMREAQAFVGSKKDEVITATIAIHYPGVKINPRQIRINVIP